MPKSLRFTIITCSIVLGLVLIGVAIAYTYGMSPKIVNPLGFAFGGISILVPLAIFTRYRQVTRDVARIRNGDYWMHWQYDSSFWQQYAPTAWFGTPLRGQAATPYTWAWPVILMTALMGFCLGWFTAGLWEGLVISILLTVFVISFSMVLLFGYHRSVPQSAIPLLVDLYLSAFAIYATDQPEQVLHLKYPGLRLQQVQIETGLPSFLVFDATYNQGGQQQVESTLKIPIPPGEEEHAVTLADKYRQQHLQHSSLSSR
jgi:hypothetical protein